MSRQQNDYRQQFLPEVDHRSAVWQAYLNVVNSFSGIDMMGFSEASEGSLNISRTPMERFIFCLGILDGMLEEDKDDPFKKKPDGTLYPYNSIYDLLGTYNEKSTSKTMGNAELTGLLGRLTYHDFREYFAYWTRIDSLMRRQAMFTTGKVQTARI